MCGQDSFSQVRNQILTVSWFSFLVIGRVGTGPRLKVAYTSEKSRYFRSNMRVFCCLQNQNLYLTLHSKAEINAKRFRNCVWCYVQKTLLFWKYKVNVFLSLWASEHGYSDLDNLYYRYICCPPFNFRQWVSLILGYRLRDAVLMIPIQFST